MAEQRVTQLPGQFSGTPSDSQARVTQLPVQLSGTLDPTVVFARITQFPVQISATMGTPVTQASTFVDADTFPAGADVTKTPLGIPVSQDNTFVDADSFPAGAVVDVLTPIPVTQNATFVDADSFPAGANVGNVVPMPNIPFVGQGGRPHSIPKKNVADEALAAEMVMWQDAFQAQGSGVSGGVSGLGNLPGYFPALSRDAGPTLMSKDGHRLFFQRGKVITPAPADGDVLVMEFMVPIGYWGRVLSYYTHYTGTGWVDGGGDIYWRFRVGNAWVRNMGEVGYQVGSFTNPWPIQDFSLLLSGQMVRVYANVPNVSGNIDVGSSLVLAGLHGVFYPNTAMGGKQ